MMVTPSLAAILRRDLEAVRREVEGYPDEALLWTRVPGMPNTGGVLVRHLCGNLQHFIGTVLGGTPYRRDRDAEFLALPSPRGTLLEELSATQTAVAATLARLPEQWLEADYPAPVGGQRLGTLDFLLHLSAHCAFHLGQIDYHRRAVTGLTSSVAPMAISSLATARVAPPPS
jgi:hypothetical protein